MNFLQLCQEVVTETGSSSSVSSVATASGEALRIVNWVKRAWTEIQQAADWDWLGADFSFSTTASKRDYDPLLAPVSLTRFKRWQPETFRIYKTSLGQTDEQYLVEHDWDWYRDVYLFGAEASSTSRPVIFAIRPEDKAIMLGPNPDATYTIAGRYLKGPQTLTDNTDELDGIPSDFEMLVVHKAVMKHAAWDAAPETYSMARDQYKTLFMEMVGRCLPTIHPAGPLA